MDSFELDLCLSCGTHVADGTPYCSSRCRKADTHQQVSPSSSAPRSVYLYAASSSQGPSTSSHYHHYAPAHSNRRRPLLDLQDQSFCEEEQQVTNKLVSIAEWAQGVYGASYDEDECLRMKAAAAPRRGSIPMATPSKTKLPSKHTHSASLSPSRQYSPPRFALTAQGLAPPAMSIATVDDSDMSSIVTPSTSPSAVVMIKDSRRKSAEMVDPWISSPPYEFAYKQHQTERGRPLVRV